MLKNQCILAIDTATGPCSVALWRDGAILGTLEEPGSNKQSAILLPMVEKLLKQHSLPYAALTLVACTTGPGSFTSIRVGLATARGIALAANIKSAGFTTLAVMARAAKGNAPVLAALNAGKGQWYYQAFSPELTPLCEARLGAPEEAAASVPQGALFAGNIALPEGLVASGVTAPAAAALAELAAGTGEHSPALQPFYIRPPDAIIPSKII